MHLPQKKKNDTRQRLMFRRILLSATLLLPAGSMSAEESGKPTGEVAGVSNTKPQAVLPLPSFPAAPTTSQGSSTASTPSTGSPPAITSAKTAATVSPQLPTLPPTGLAPPPISGTRPVGATTAAIPPKVADASPVSGKSESSSSISSSKKLGVPIADTTTSAKSTAAKAPEISVVFPGTNSTATPNQNNKQPSSDAESKRVTNSSAPAVSLNSPNAPSPLPTPVKNMTKSDAAVQPAGVKGEEGDDGVMIRFGVKPRAEAEGIVRGIPGGKKEPIPTTTPASQSSSFRLSDKTNIAIAPKPEAKPATTAPQVVAPKVAAVPAVNSLPKLPTNPAELAASKPTQAETAKPSATSPALPNSNAPAASTTANKTLSNGLPKGTVATMPTSGVVAQQKSEAREAVIFRPKAMIVEAAPSAPSAMETKATDKALEAPGSSRVPVIANRAPAATSSEGSVTLAVEPTFDLAASAKEARNAESDSTSTALSELVGSSSKAEPNATGVKSSLPTATTIVSSQPPKAITTAATGSVPKTIVKQPAAEDAMIALAEPINPDTSSVVNSKTAVALLKSGPLPPADRVIKVGTAAFSTMRLGDQQVEKCEVADTNICRAVVTTDGEVAFLPGKVGVTRATLWLKQKSGESKVETAEITVGEALATGSTAGGDLEKLNSTLKDLYPGCELSAVAGDRCIEIRGEVDSEQQAKAVLQLVRKLCLVPVKDKVSVR